MTWADAVYLTVIAATVIGAYLLHRSSWHTTRLFWGGLACLLAWAGWLALMPPDPPLLSWWMAVDAPLNFGWIFLWCWPLMVESWRSSRESLRVTRHNWRLLREALAKSAQDPDRPRGR